MPTMTETEALPTRSFEVGSPDTAKHLAEREAARLTESARNVAAQRRLIETECLECGTPVLATVRKRYCSHACQMRYWRRGQKGRRRGDSG